MSDVFWLIPLAAVLAAPIIVIFSMWSRMRMRELQVRERIAMIEKGLVPPPEVDPAGFDRAMARYERSTGSDRGRRAGIMVIGVGLGLVFIISVAGDSVREGLGVGGFLVMIGLALLVNGLLEPSDRHAPVPPATRTPPVE